MWILIWGGLPLAHLCFRPRNAVICIVRSGLGELRPGTACVRSQPAERASSV